MDESTPANRSQPISAPLAAVAPLPPPPRRGIRPAYIIMAVIAVALVAATVHYYMRNVAPFETSDDAFIDGDVTFVSPRVAGPVIRLLVNDNQEVKAGDPLLEIDPADYETRVAKARADLATAKARLEQARAQVAVDDAKIEQQKAALTSAEALAARATADRSRYEAVSSQAISRSQLDLAQTSANSAAADVEAARSQVKAAAAALEPDRANIEAGAAAVQEAQAQLDQATLDLSYTKLAAPRGGRVTRRTVQQGAYVQAGQALLALVPDDVWVVANFKETQLERLRPGQPVSIRIDAYPGREFKGKVDSLQYGSGARFSLLPPENAVGNYVKVVQRVPVKIVFDEPIREAGLDLGPGMSAEPKVRVK